MQERRTFGLVWYAGKTRRERIAVLLALLSACFALIWALVNDMRYGSEGTESQSRLYTNGRFDIAVVQAVFLSLLATGAFFVLLFWVFRFLDIKRNPESRGL